MYKKNFSKKESCTAGFTRKRGNRRFFLSARVASSGCVFYFIGDFEEISYKVKNSLNLIFKKEAVNL